MPTFSRVPVERGKGERDEGGRGMEGWLVLVMACSRSQFYLQYLHNAEQRGSALPVFARDYWAVTYQV